MVLKFSLQQAYGFCPHETDLFSALVVANESGAYTFCGTELVEAPDWCPNCVRGVTRPSPCLVELPLAQRILTAQQAHQLDDLLAAVPDANCDDEPVVVDWCLISVYEFLGRREDGLCTIGLVNREFSAAIGAIDIFLRGLRDTQ